MPLAPPANRFTSQAEIEALWSATAALDRVDHDGDGVADSYTDIDAASRAIWDDVIDEATDIVGSYLEQWYDPADMELHTTVRRLASWIGAYLISAHRGNPEQFVSQYERVIAFLDAIDGYKRRIPRLAFRADLVPGMSNYVIDMRHPVRKVRVQRPISVGGTYTKQDRDHLAEALDYPGILM